MVEIIKPPRRDIDRITGGDTRLTRAIESLFDVAGDQTPQDVTALEDQVAELELRAIPEPPSGQTTVDFPLTLAATAPRRLKWDDDAGSLELGLAEGGMVLGQSLVYPVRNGSGTAITQGEALSISGVTSGQLDVAATVSDGSVKPNLFFGVAHSDIADGATGFAVVFGAFELDTTGLTVGGTLYSDPTTAGAWTTTKPAAPNWRQPFGLVLSTGNAILRFNGEAEGASGSFTADGGEVVTVTDGIITGIV